MSQEMGMLQNFNFKTFQVYSSSLKLVAFSIVSSISKLFKFIVHLVKEHVLNDLFNNFKTFQVYSSSLLF